MHKDNLPACYEPHSPACQPVPHVCGAGYPEVEPADAPVPLTHYLWILNRHRWKILSFVGASVLATFIVSSRLTPVYESTATIDVDRRMPTGVIGQEATVSALNDADQFMATQVRLIQSDSVLRPVVQRFRLAEPERGGEQSSLKSSAADAPVVLRKLKVTRPPNTYLLLINYRSPDRRMAADIANAVAQSYLEHTYTIRFRSNAAMSSFMEKQIEELKAKMERSSAALVGFERELNVINPEEKTSILSSRLLQLNTEYTNAQSDRVRKEAAFGSVRDGSLESAQVSSQGDALKRLQEHLDEAQENLARVSVYYGANHPEYRRAAARLQEVQLQFTNTRNSISKRVKVEYQEALNRESMLNKAVADTKAEFDKLNARSFEYQTLKREAEADKKLYEDLVRKIKEAGLNAGFQGNSIRLADPARPGIKPVFPNLKLNAVLALVFSALLSVGVAVIADAIDNTVRDPEMVRRALNTEVIGSLPLVKSWRGKLAFAGTASPPHALAHLNTSRERALTSFEEAVCTLRNSILLGNFGRPLKSLMLTSASPSEGKTTTGLYLAFAHAHQRQRTLLVDGDLRRPSIHRKLNLKNESGLADALSNGMNWRDKVVTLDALPDLHILTSGPASRRAADLIGQGLPRILAEAASEYDLVIVDAPPALGFPEPLQMATAVDGVIMVARAGETNRKALSAALATLSRLRAHVLGLVLNEVTHQMSDSYYYYNYYGYSGRRYKYYGSQE